MYKHTLRVNGEYLAKAQTLPANSSSVGNGGSIKAGSTMGAVEVVMAAADAVSIPASTQLTLQLEGSDDNTTFTLLPVNFVVTTAGSVTKYKKGEELARLPIPSNAPKHVRCRIVTNKTGVTGGVDVFCDFLPR
ncbi:hypothetical protein [Halodesulfovibrio marinisediminis]|uniref:Uncharacterized protein n=1 Tax=Halodesulfovibrio marinisediminis DSM 17456 TaxID=1121457 RepID=A0A1N6IXP6_9BACT|nr:hypothetical protein [Halodesulfovibrio marinisediminis]SIO36834.1 hypothetical protein SAMN02745161_3037 [Halodesulfovibrio marinisediminis DSM 17456]